jgi:V/A-type H+-transporting ATPase subunit C
MPVNVEFVEKSEYAYAVARIRAIETKLVDGKGYNTIIASPMDRFYAVFSEVTGVKADGVSGLGAALKSLEDSFTQTLYLVKSLILEDEINRLVSLKYDYELLKLIVKESKGHEAAIPTEISERSNYSYPVLKSLLEGGKALETGSIILDTYVSLREARDQTGNFIDNRCDRAYYTELFQILDWYGNSFLSEYFIRKIDAVNITTTLRLKLQGAKRSSLRERILPFGSIDASYFEQGIDLNLEGFSSRIIFSPLSRVLSGVGKRDDEEEQIAQVERLLEEELLRYLKESLFVTFGIEPLIAYLWVRETEVRNLRTILLAKNAGIDNDEIKMYVRGYNV